MPVMPIPTDWDGVEWGCCIVEWPASPMWQAILLGLVTYPSIGRFWDRRTGTITDAQSVGREIFLRNLCLWETDTMGCLDELVAELGAIRNVISLGMFNNSCGCNGSSGSGITPTNPAPFQDNGANYPDYYDSRAEYLATKCDLAEYVRQQMVASLRQLRTVQSAGISVATLAALLTPLLLLPIAYVVVLEIATALLALTALGIGVFVTAIDELIEYWQDTFDICLLYEATSSESALQNVYNDIDSQSFSVDVITKELGKYLLQPDATNLLFGDLPSTMNAEALPVGDCLNCSIAMCEFIYDPLFYPAGQGSEPSFPGGTFHSVVAPQPQFNNQVVRVTLNIDCTDKCFIISDINLIGSWGDPNTHPLQFEWTHPTAGPVTINIRNSTLPIPCEPIAPGSPIYFTSTSAELGFEATLTIE